MSTKTFFKRAALVIVASLGFGMLSVPSSQAAVTNPSVALSAATATATTLDTASVTLTIRFTADAASDTFTVVPSCDAPTGQTCPSLQGLQLATADTFNVAVVGDRVGVWTTLGTNTGAVGAGWQETATTGTPTFSVRSVVSLKAVQFPKAGTYTYTLQGYGKSGVAITGASTTWTVTVTNANTAASTIANYYLLLPIRKLSIGVRLRQERTMQLREILPSLLPQEQQQPQLLQASSIWFLQILQEIQE